MKRIYYSMVKEHLANHRQMVLLSGPRQVGKTTCSLLFQGGRDAFHYLNWETAKHRQLIIRGAQAVAEHCRLEELTTHKPLIVFDELHKYRKWKFFLKGFFDLYEKQCQILVTGSAKLNVYQKGGDSLMGRYFPYRVHPLSVGELLSADFREQEIVPPRELANEELDHLIQFGGFPEPFQKRSKRFSNTWQRLRREQLLKEDIRALSQIQDLSEIEMLMNLLEREVGGQLNMSSIAGVLNVAETTVKRWINMLEQFYFCYRVKPWSKNIRAAIRKTPKIFLWDWSKVTDPGARAENFVGSHLLKAVHYWTDVGLGEYDLHYLRNKAKQEVDFLVVKDQVPWILAEVKSSPNKGISKALHHFQNELNVPHAFQVVLDMPYVNADCFAQEGPAIVPASTFLSQLV